MKKKNDWQRKAIKSAIISILFTIGAGFRSLYVEDYMWYADATMVLCALAIIFFAGKFLYHIASADID